MKRTGFYGVYKQGLRPKRKGAKAVAAETGFYASEVEGAENTTEPIIAEIETIAAKHLQKLRTGNINLTRPGACRVRNVHGNHQVADQVRSGPDELDRA